MGVKDIKQNNQDPPRLNRLAVSFGAVSNLNFQNLEPRHLLQILYADYNSLVLLADWNNF